MLVAIISLSSAFAIDNHTLTSVSTTTDKTTSLVTQILVDTQTETSILVQTETETQNQFQTVTTTATQTVTSTFTTQYNVTSTVTETLSSSTVTTSTSTLQSVTCQDCFAVSILGLSGNIGGTCGYENESLLVCFFNSGTGGIVTFSFMSYLSYPVCVQVITTSLTNVSSTNSNPGVAGKVNSSGLPVCVNGSGIDVTAFATVSIPVAVSLTNGDTGQQDATFQFQVVEE